MIGALVPVIAIGVLLLALAPVLRPPRHYNLLIFFVGLVAAMVFAGVPTPFLRTGDLRLSRDHHPHAR